MEKKFCDKCEVEIKKNDNFGTFPREDKNGNKIKEVEMADLCTICFKQMQEEEIKIENDYKKKKINLLKKYNILYESDRKK